jgi:hypothetical protein
MDYTEPTETGPIEGGPLFPVRGKTVVEELYYKAEHCGGRDPMTSLIIPASIGPEVPSASNRNECQKIYWQTLCWRKI